MKRIFFLIAVIITAVACNNADQNAGPGTTGAGINKALQDSGNYTTIQWMDSTYTNLGVIKEGQVVEVAFRFKNTGSKNLIITDVMAGCGCTIPEKPAQPYAPGQEGVIKAKFNTENRVGLNRKEIYVTANTNPNVQTLSFRAEVEE